MVRSQLKKHSLLAEVYPCKKLIRKKCLLNLRTAYISAEKFLISTVILVAIILHQPLLLVELLERLLEKTRKCNIKKRNRDSCFFFYIAMKSLSAISQIYQRFCNYIGDFSNISTYRQEATNICSM